MFRSECGRSFAVDRCFGQRKLSRQYIVILLICVFPMLANAELTGFDLRNYSGKIVLLDFWGSWCRACRHSFPWMNAMKAKYGNKGLIIVAVNNDLEKEEGMAFLEEYQANFEIIWDQDYVLAREYNVQAMPASFLIGPDGRILHRQVGFKVAEQGNYEAEIAVALENLKSKTVRSRQ
jgi:thiol-disulfide isomerase/thioredoxin